MARLGQGVLILGADQLSIPNYTHTGYITSGITHRFTFISSKILPKPFKGETVESYLLRIQRELGSTVEILDTWHCPIFFATISDYIALLYHSAPVEHRSATVTECIQVELQFPNLNDVPDSTKEKLQKIKHSLIKEAGEKFTPLARKLFQQKDEL